MQSYSEVKVWANNTDRIKVYILLKTSQHENILSTLLEITK